MAIEKPRHGLQSGCQQLALDLSGQQIDRLLAFMELLQKWNRAYNLTAVRDPLEMVGRHLLDSLAVAPWIKAKRVLDIGSGAGLPGIPLAIAMPHHHFTLLDSNGKKSRFQIQAQMELGLDNIEVINTRLEHYQPEQRFGQAISRAFASLQRFVEGAGPVLQSGGELLAMKGVYPADELQQLSPGLKRVDCIELNVPDSCGCRHLVVVQIGAPSSIEPERNMDRL